MNNLLTAGASRKQNLVFVGTSVVTLIVGCIRGVFFYNREPAGAAAVQIEQE